MTTTLTPTATFATLARDAFAHALSLVLPAVPAKTTLPILSNVLLEVVDDVDGAVLVLTCTNLDMTVRHRVALTSGIVSAITLPAKKLADVLATLPAGPVTLTFSKNGVRIAAGSAKVLLLSAPADEFPTMMASAAFRAVGTLPALTLHMLGEQVAFAASQEESRPIINGVLLEKVGTTLRAVATNGHKLALAATTLGADMLSADDCQYILPPALLAAARRAIAGDDTVTVQSSTNAITFSTAATEVTGRLIEGPYPNYQSVIPTTNDKTATGDRLSFMASLKRVAVIASDETHRVKLSFGPLRATVSAKTPDLGEASDVLAVTYAGDELDIGVNAAYLLELLKQTPSEHVTLAASGPERAMVLTPVTLPASLSECLMIVMPLRLVD